LKDFVIRNTIRDADRNTEMYSWTQMYDGYPRQAARVLC